MIDFRLAGPKCVDEFLRHHPATRRTVLLEAHFSSSDHPLTDAPLARKHIPGAIQVHPSYLEAGNNRKKYYPYYDCPADGNLLPQPLLIAAIEALGITPDTEVIVYGAEPDGPMAAARLVWGLMYAGIKKVRLLDGGIRAWLAHGGKTLPHVRTPELLNNRPGTSGRNGPSCTWKIQSQFLATTEEIQKMVSSRPAKNYRLVDVRRTGEYTGEMTQCYPFYSKAGHIPTAVPQGNWDTQVDHNSQLIGPKLQEIKHRWTESGIIDPDSGQQQTSLVFYCGTGWRSSIPFLIATLLGIPARNYDAGFYGWSWNSENEIATMSEVHG